MDRVVKKIATGLFVLCSVYSLGQDRVTTVGLQFKPMFSNSFFDTGATSEENSDFKGTISPRFGINFGMVIRRGLTKTWSLETGICMVQRNYRIEFDHTLLAENAALNYRFIGYEIPLQALIYLRLGERTWMNASGGASIDMFPTDTYSSSGLFVDTIPIDYEQRTYRRRWVQSALITNLGFEYRTKEKGYYYLGVSFHRPFFDIATARLTMLVDSDPSDLYINLNGSYLTVDLRYFFHEKPGRKRKV